MIAIDKGITPPVRHEKALYPWKEMEIGDSFAIDAGPTGTISFLSAQAGMASKELGRKFVCKTVIEKEVRRFRIWRVE